jgi:hypothetical protein
MLRVLHRLVLRAHPPYFRQRFAEEMQSIFDQAGGTLAAASLLADAILSLGRQWTLRPEFWEEPALAAVGHGAPLFSTLDSNKPRTSALVYGAFMSALVLNGICWAMGYAWNHPTFMEIRRPVIVPPASWKARPTPPPDATTSAEPGLYTDEGRVVLVFNAPAHASMDASPTDKASPPASTTAAYPANSSSPSGNLGVDSSPSVLRSYIGTYISNSAERERVIVTVDGGRLQLEVVGAFRSPLSPLPKPQLLACAVRDCWVAFSSSTEGTVDRIEIHYSGREIQAFRAQGAVF